MAEGMKKYILMHKNIQVADMELDEATCAVSAVSHVYSESHVPVGIPVKKGVINRAALNEWWKGRAIPASRAGIRNALEQLNLSTTQKLLEKCLGLSLSDQYWICPAGSGIEWSQVNFLEHAFSDDVGNILFAEHFLTPYACEFARNENGYYHFPLQAGAIALHELKTVFPECKEWIISEESLNATICQCYPTYRTDYNAIVSEQEQIPDVKAPINLFLQEQLDQEKSQMQNTEQEEKLQEFEENMTQEESQGYEEDDEYGEQIEFGY